MRRRHRQCVSSLWIVLAFGDLAHGADRVDFARDVAPLIQKHCIRCHQPSNRKGDLSLATVDDAIASEYVLPKDAKNSPLIDLVTAAATGKRPAMPKEGNALSPEQVTKLREWIDQGANWPKDLVIQERAAADKSWWSLQPLSNPTLPAADDLPAGWNKNPIDRFIGARLLEKGLRPSPPAAKRALLRRAAYDLTGLPPTAQEIDDFLADASPQAFERVIDRLLASSAYGEQWGRHWLDVVRFGESTGFERNVIIDNAWPFRDYVINSFNEDKPFDQLALEHLAGDVLAPGDPRVEVGVAFLVAGPYDNVGNQDAVQAAQIRANTIDDVVRATGEAFLGMTIGCARCHNHKFDPILASDYYSLYATFAGVNHGSRVVASAGAQLEHGEKVGKLHAERDRLAAERAKIDADISERATATEATHAAKWLRPPINRAGTEERFSPVEAGFVRLVCEGIDAAPENAAGFRIEEFEVWTAGDGARNVALQSEGARAQGQSRVAQDFADAYSPSLVNDGRFGARWIAAAPNLTIVLPKPTRIERVWFSSDKSGGAGNNPEATFVCEYHIDMSLDGKTWATVASSHDRKPVNDAHRKYRLRQLVITADEQAWLDAIARDQGQVAAKIAAAGALPNWWVGNPSPAPGPFHVFVGGDPQRKGDVAVPASFSFLDGVAKPFRLAGSEPEAQRRLALARWIVQADNPLTPRVLANRVWQHHFGTGIVDTPSDFGYMGSTPTHPELLDHLARALLDNGWKLKPLHRLIMTSLTYQQSAAWNESAAKIDGESRFLWRFPPRRLTGEEIRDSMLAAAGKLDRRMGGPGFRLYRYLEDNVATYVPLDDPGSETYRRAVYHQNARAARVDVMSDFDCPDVASAAPKRHATITPLQALTLLNHRFTVDMAESFAERLRSTAGADVQKQIEAAYEIAYSRLPTANEVAAAQELIEKFGLRAFCRALFNSSEFITLH